MLGDGLDGALGLELPNGGAREGPGDAKTVGERRDSDELRLDDLVVELLVGGLVEEDLVVHLLLKLAL